MRVYAVIHSVESLDEGYSETSVKFFDYPAGAWQEMQSIQYYGDGKVAVPRIEWGETRRYIYNDSPNQVVTFFSFWRPAGDWCLVYDQSDNKPSVAKVLDVVRGMVEFSHELTWFSELRDKIAELCDEGHTMWDADEVCTHYFAVTPVLSDPTLPF
jgi:hypothetical protein